MAQHPITSSRSAPRTPYAAIAVFIVAYLGAIALLFMPEGSLTHPLNTAQTLGQP